MVSSRTSASRRSAATVQFFRRAAGQQHAEFVAREAAEIILAAQTRADALGDLRDHLLGGVEAVSFVEIAEMVDGDQQEAARGAEAYRLVELLAEHLGEVQAVHFAGQRIEFGKLQQFALARVALADRAQDAMRPHRLAVGAGEPASGIFQPDFLVTAPEGVLHLVGDAARRYRPAPQR